MKKIDEKIDLSRAVLDIDIESPVFNCLLMDINKEIQRCIQKVYDGEFEAGEISVKLTIELPETFTDIPKENEFGEMVNEIYEYKQPKFEHKVTTTLKKKYTQEGIFTGDREVEFRDGKYVTVPIYDCQLRLVD